MFCKKRDFEVRKYGSNLTSCNYEGEITINMTVPRVLIKHFQLDKLAEAKLCFAISIQSYMCACTYMRMCVLYVCVCGGVNAYACACLYLWLYLSTCQCVG